MFEGTKSFFKKRNERKMAEEKEARLDGMKTRLQRGINQVKRKRDIVEHEKTKLEGEIENLFARAEHFKQTGKIDDAQRFVFEAYERSKVVSYLNQALQTLSYYDTKLRKSEARVTGRQITSNLNLNGILDRDIVELAKGLADIEKREEPYNDFGLDELERELDTPIPNPARHDGDYISTKLNFESFSDADPTFQRYLSSFKSDLIPVKER